MTDIYASNYMSFHAGGKTNIDLVILLTGKRKILRPLLVLGQVRNVLVIRSERPRGLILCRNTLQVRFILCSVNANNLLQMTILVHIHKSHSRSQEQWLPC